MISGTDNRIRESRRRRNLESKKMISALVSDSQSTEQILAAAKKARANKLERIRNKLKAGKRLSTSELQYLRESAPDLYEQAARIDQQQKAFERALKQCRTEEEVNRVLTSQMQITSGMVPAVHAQQNGEEQARVSDAEFSEMYTAAIERTHRSFRAREGGKLVSAEREAEEKRREEHKKQDAFLRGLDISDSFRAPSRSAASDSASDSQKISIRA